MMKNLALTIALTGLILGSTSHSSASENPVLLSEMFGRGIHAFYLGNHEEADDLFSSAIEHGLEDPRVFYFRGMIAFKQGKTEAAVTDWEKGAEIEANSRVNRSIGRSLLRFQGAGRVQLETIRHSAKLAAFEAAMKRSEVRYGELSQTPSTEPIVAGPGITPPPIPSDIRNPFAADAASGTASVVDNDALKNAMNDPFAGEATAAPATTAPTTNNDPFGGNAPAAGNDPFGGAAPAGNDPFGAGNDPFGGANPFGN